MPSENLYAVLLLLALIVTGLLWLYTERRS